MLMTQEQAIHPTLRKYLKLFKDDQGEPYNLTPNQCHIIDLIYFRYQPRTIIIMPTQYGKSISVAFGLILSACILGERWAIVAPNEEKAKIIMSYVIEHLFDSPLFLDKLVPDTNLEKMKQERSKTRITFKNGGEVRVYSADAKNRKNVIKSLTGFGSKNIVLDESPLIEDDLYAMVKRMLGGHKDNFLLEIGNPFTRGHFLDSWKSDKYYHLYIDYQVALEEGRYTPEFIEEMRPLPYFEVLYECKFPQANAMIEGGWLPLLSDAEIELAQIPEAPTLPADVKVNRLGGDIGAGGDETAFTRRVEGEGVKFIELLETNRDPDTMAQVPRIENHMETLGIKGHEVFLDDIGVGKGLSNRLQEKGIKIIAVGAGDKPQDTERFANVKAENFWELRLFIKSGGKLVRNDKWKQLSTIYYKENSSRKLVIMPKEEMRKRGIHSPDVAESAMLTFSKKTILTSDSFAFV